MTEWLFHMALYRYRPDHDATFNTYLPQRVYRAVIRV